MQLICVNVGVTVLPDRHHLAAVYCEAFDNIRQHRRVYCGPKEISQPLCGVPIKELVRRTAAAHKEVLQSVEARGPENL